MSNDNTTPANQTLPRGRQLGYSELVREVEQLPRHMLPGLLVNVVLLLQEKKVFKRDQAITELVTNVLKDR